MRYAQSYSFRRREPPKNPLSFLKRGRRWLIAEREEKWRSYTNHFKSKKKMRLSHMAPAAFFSLGLAWLSLMLYLPYFRVTNLTVSGLKIIKPEEIDTLVRNQFLSSGRFWPKNNYFLIRGAAITEAIQKKFAFNTVEVTKIFPHSVAINLEEKVSSIIYDNGSQYWLLDQDGKAAQYLRDVTSTEFELAGESAPTSTEQAVLGAKISASSSLAASSTSTLMISVHTPNFKKIQQEYGKYPLIYDARNIRVSAGQGNIMSPAVIQGIIDFFNGLERKKIAAVKYMIMSDPAAGVTAVVDRPWKILFQPYSPIQPQLENLKIVLRDNRPFQYVDVRFGNRIYWK